MSDQLRMELEQGQNPFKFEPNDKDAIEEYQDKPMVVMAGPGMLQCGLSRELFLKWADGKALDLGDFFQVHISNEMTSRGEMCHW